MKKKFFLLLALNPLMIKSSEAEYKLLSEVQTVEKAAGERVITNEETLERKRSRRAINKCCDECCQISKRLCCIAFAVTGVAVSSYLAYEDGYAHGTALQNPPSNAITISDTRLNQNYFGVIYGCPYNNTQLPSFATRAQCRTQQSSKEAFDDFVNKYAQLCGGLAQYYLYPSFLGCSPQGLEASYQELGDMLYQPDLYPLSKPQPPKVPEKVAKIKAKLQTKNRKAFMPQARHNKTRRK